MEINQIVRRNILQMQPYSSAREEFKAIEASMVFLDANENPFENNVNRYPDPQQKKVKAVLSQIKNIAENQILLGNGSDEVLDLLFRAFCEPNLDNVITLPPTYGMYGVLANLNAVENREVLLTEDFMPNSEAISNMIDKNTKIIFLCSPNNPTGNSFPNETIVKLLEHFKGIVVVDEAYIDFSETESWLTKLCNYPNLVVVQTLSKAYGMAGIRMGILFASDAIVAILNKIKPPYNLNVLTQQKAIETLLQMQKNQDIIHYVKIERNLLFKELLNISFIEKVFHSEANFLLIKVDDADVRYTQLLKNGIVIRNRSNQPLCDNCLRITVGTKEENTLLINTLKSLQ